VTFIKKSPFTIDMEYAEMLKKASNELPKVVFEKARFEIPNVRGHIQGNKTVITNFSQIASALNRPIDHFIKYLFKELATPGELRNRALVLGRKVAASAVNEKVRKYAEEFVLCSECGKPDTRIEKEGQFNHMRCTACGAKHIIKSVL
jgi:translation initiation factor 2 subunit 2